MLRKMLTNSYCRKNSSDFKLILLKFMINTFKTLCSNQPDVSVTPLHHKSNKPPSL